MKHSNLTLNPSNGASLTIREECVEDKRKAIIFMSHRGEVLYTVLNEAEIKQLKKCVDNMCRKKRTK